MEKHPVLVATKLTPEAARDLKSLAEKNGATVSGYIRRMIEVKLNTQKKR